MRFSAARVAASLAVVLGIAAGSGRAARADDAPLATPPASSAAAATMIVTIDTPDQVVLEAQQEDGTWKEVCTSPCNQALPPKPQYRINGSGVRPSHPFNLLPGQAVRLEVETSSSGAHTTGIILVVVGAIGLVPGLVVTAAEATALFVGLILICPISEAISKGSYGPCLGDIATYIGQGYVQPYVWFPALAGAVMLAGGGTILATTPASAVNQRVTPLPSTPAAPGSAPGNAPITMRQPAWLDGRSAAEAAFTAGPSPLLPSAAAAIPVFRLAF